MNIITVKCWFMFIFRFPFVCFSVLISVILFLCCLLWFCYVFRLLVLRQEIGWEECPQNDQFCVEWDAKP